MINVKKLPRGDLVQADTPIYKVPERQLKPAKKPAPTKPDKPQRNA